MASLAKQFNNPRALSGALATLSARPSELYY